MKQTKVVTIILILVLILVTAKAALGEVSINEFSAVDEWIELYSDTGQDLTGWTIEDGTASQVSLNGLNIAAEGYLFLDSLSFALNDAGDIITLTNGSETDTVTYGSFNDGNVSDNQPAPGANQSLGRISDGNAQWTIFTTPTPNATNNKKPTAENNTVTTQEEVNYVFAAADFKYADTENNTFTSVKISSLPSVGSLQLNNVTVVLNQVIATVDITAGKLIFVPIKDGSGDNYDSFQFTVNDGFQNSALSYSMTLKVTPVNDAPAVTALPDQNATEAIAFSVLVNATDIDTNQSALSIDTSASTLPSWLKVDGTNKLLLTGTPDNKAVGTTEVKVIVTDGTNKSAEEKFNLTVQPALELKNVTMDGKAAENITNASLGQKITIAFDFVNNFNKKLGHVETSANVASGTDFVNHQGKCSGAATCDGQDWVLEPAEQGKDAFTFQVPFDFTGTAFDLKINVGYDDFWSKYFSWLGAGEEYATTQTIKFNVVKKDVEIYLENASLDDDNLTCTRTAAVTLDLINTGTETITPELLVYDVKAVESSFNKATGTFDSFENGAVPKVKEFFTLSSVSSGSKTETKTLNLSSLPAGVHTLYVYVTNPYFESGFIGASTTLSVTVADGCLNAAEIEKAMTISSLTTKTLDLFAKDKNNLYLYINEDNTTHESALKFNVTDQTDTSLTSCSVASDGHTLSCTAPLTDKKGTSTVKIKVTDNAVSGKAILVEEKSVAVTVTPSLAISSVKVNNIAVSAGGNTTAVKPNDKITVEFTVTNGLNYPVTDMAAAFSSSALTLTSDTKLNVNAGGSTQMTLTGTVPLTTAEGNYAADLTVTGKNFNDLSTVIGDAFSFNVNVQQDPADVVISKLTLENDTLTCKPTTTLTVDLENKGQNKEDDVIITVTGSNVNLSTENEGLITMEKNTQNTQDFTIEASNLTSGSNTLTVEVAYRNKFEKETSTVTVTKKNCLGAFSPASTTLTLADGAAQEFNVTLAEQGFENTVTWYKNNVEVVKGKTSYTFSEATAGTYTLKAAVNANTAETQTWTVTVADKPVSKSVTSNIASDVSQATLASFTNLTLENNFGKVAFTQPVDLSSLVDLDAVVLVQDGLVAIDSAKAPELNKPATITIKKTFSNHQIQRSTGFNDNKFETCPATVCSVLSNTNGQFVFTVTGFSTYTVQEKQSAAIDIADIFFDNVNRGDNVTMNVTIKNTGSQGEDLAGLTVALSGVNSQYNAQLVGTVPTTLAAGSSITLELKLTVPKDEDGGKHSIGSVSVTSDKASASETIYVNPKSFLTIESININDKTSGDLTPEEDNDIEVEIKNSYTENMEDVEVTVTILDVDEEDLEEEETIDELDEGDTEEMTFQFDLRGEELDEEEYTIEVVVEGEAEDGSKHKITETKTVDVERENHKVVIDHASISSTTLQCLRQATLQVTVENVGKSNEDDVEVRVQNTLLNLDLRKSNIDLDKFSDSDNDYKATFALDLEKAAPGSYPLLIEVYRDGDLEESTDLNVEITECATTSTTQTQSVVTDNLAAQLQQQLQQDVQAKKAQQAASSVVQTSLRGSDTYVYLLGALIVLVFIALVLALAVVLRKKH
ncbi:hypothetical protein J4228_01980 [Candidatus Woesearchaeota archaeon]|nr:hypothetical protein [Candidatus Woesearchaeota archaeon]